MKLKQETGMNLRPWHEAIKDYLQTVESLSLVHLLLHPWAYLPLHKLSKIMLSLVNILNTLITLYFSLMQPQAGLKVNNNL
jgi:hypothetical protein